MRTLLCTAIIALTACSAEKPPQRVAADAAIRQGQELMEPVHHELQTGLDKWGKEIEARNAERREAARRRREGEPVRSCIIDGVRTFDNRGNLCPDEDAPTAN